MKLRVKYCRWFVFCGFLMVNPGAFPASLPVAVSASYSGTANLPLTGDVAPSVVANPEELLSRVRRESGTMYAELKNFVCNEEMDRYRGPLNKDGGRQVDTITAKVSFESGIEHYSQIQQNGLPKAQISLLPGAWSEGEFGTLLRQTQVLLSTQRVQFRNYETFDGSSAAVFEFDVAGDESPWDLEVGGRHYRLPFRTSVWVSRSTAQILQIHRSSLEISPDTGISVIEWSVRLAPTELNSKSWFLPSSGSYSVTYDLAGRREWNTLKFTDYHRYGSQVALRFDGVK